MARKGSSRGKGTFKAKSAPGATINKMERYEDTLQEGGVDEFMFKRDQIMFNPQEESDHEDINGDQGDEVLALDVPRRDADQEDDDEDDEDEDMAVAPKKRKEKLKPDYSSQGRFGKGEVDSDEEFDENEGSDESGSGSDEEEEEGWGRQYYSRPSTRREKERDDVYDEKREEERELEEKEVKRLQRREREQLEGADVWGLDDVDVEYAAPTAEEDEETEKAAIPAPETDDPAALIRHMQFHEPLKLALARDFPLVLRKLKKTARGIKKMEAENEGEETLHKGLGWLHYQTLLTYATTLAFYIHLCALPAEQRTEMDMQPVIQRLLQLKEGVGALEDLDFAAGSVSDKGPELYVRPGMGELDDEDEEELEAVLQAKRELMGRMNEASGSGLPDDEDAWDEIDEDADAQNLWSTSGLDEKELQDLLADAEASSKQSKGKKDKKERKRGSKKSKKARMEEDDQDEPSSSTAFVPIEEPKFVSSTSSKKKRKSSAIAPGDDDDTLGDMLELSEADAGDKEHKKKSLRFHTAKIASMSARRSAARERRLGGDDDVPYRDRQAARDAALRKNAPKGDGGEDLDGSDWTESDRKRAREVRDEEVAEAEDDGYYDLVKRRKVAKEEAKEAAHEEFREAKFASFQDEKSEGPRTITRAIEKNRGLTPRRSKTGRNPRVKKKLAYEKAKQKVGSQRAVYKGGQSALGGSYAGEKSGISTVTKSRKF